MRKLPSKPALSEMDRRVKKRCEDRSPSGLPCVRHQGHTPLRLNGVDLPREFRGLEVDHIGSDGDGWYSW